jgi:hypothetical protein
MERRGRSVGAALALAGMVLAGCGGDDDAGDDDEGADDGSTPEVDEEIVLEDDFSDASSGFTVSQNDTGSLGYTDGAYLIDALGAGTFKISDTDLDGDAFVGSASVLGDVRLEADVAKASEDDTAVMGLVCRLVTGAVPGYYAALFDADGYWQIRRFSGSGQVLAESSAGTTVRGLGADGGDRLRLDCVDGQEGATIAMYLNDDLIASAVDPSPLPAGSAGMAAGPRGASVRGAARFDDLRVTILR